MMLRLVPKSVRYYSGTVAALWAGRTAVGLELTLSTIGLICLALIPLVLVYSRIEERVKENEGAGAKDNQGGMLLNLAEGLNKVRFAAPDDEGTAQKANDIVRKELDKRCISYQEYKAIREKNNVVFGAVLSDEDDLVGFFDVFPLTHKAAVDVLNGRKRDADISINDIVPEAENAKAKYVYIATIMYNKNQKSFSERIGKEIVSLKLYEYVLQRFYPLDHRTLLAYGHTDEGRRLLEKAKFTVRRTAKDNVQRRPLYVLAAERGEAVRSRYVNICRALAALEGRSSG